MFGRMLDTRLASMPVGLYPVANAAWSEAGLTWNTKPAAGATAVDTETVSGTTGTWYTYDVTNYLKQQKAAGAAGVSFALKAPSASEGWAGFQTDEAASNRPELVCRQAAQHRRLHHRLRHLPLLRRRLRLHPPPPPPLGRRDGAGRGGQPRPRRLLRRHELRLEHQHGGEVGHGAGLHARDVPAASTCPASARPTPASPRPRSGSSAGCSTARSCRA